MIHSIIWASVVFFISPLLVVSVSTMAYVAPVGCDTDDPACTPPTNHTLLNLLYVFEFHGSLDGSLKRVQEIDVEAAPLWIKMHPNNKCLYLVSADNDPDKNGWIHSFSIDPSTGMLTLMNRVSSQGIAPVHIGIDATGGYLFTVNYVTGNVLVFELDTDGSVGKATDSHQHYGHSVNPDRQTSPHPHSINVYPVTQHLNKSSQFVYVPDLGLDRVYQYVFDPSTGKLENNSQPFFTTPPGAGPRHMAFNPNASRSQANIYLLSEMASTITALKTYGKTGLMAEVQTISTLVGATKFNKAAELYLYPTTGLPSFLYASNRGPDTNYIARYKVDTKSGHLSDTTKFSTGVSFPRHFRIVDTHLDKDLILVEGQDSHNISPFYIDRSSGSLTRTSADNTPVSTPACIVTWHS